MKLFALITALCCAQPGFAGSRPLVRLPADKLASLAPALVGGNMALVESNPDGTMKQVTMLLFVKAKPETLHDVIARPGDYKNFVRNVSKSTWEKGADGEYQSAWQMELPVSEFDGVNVYKFEPGPAGAIELHAIDPNDEATYRWEMIPVRGGTVLVQYGYTDVLHSNKFVRSFVKRQATMEHGLALAAQLIMCVAMKAEAEKRTPAGTVEAVQYDPKISFAFMLERGQVAVMRSGPGGKFGDISVSDMVFAPKAKLAEAIDHPAEYAKFIPGVKNSNARSEGQNIIYTMELSVPLVTWSTTYMMHPVAAGFEGAGVDGDLIGARFAWNTISKNDKTLLVYRVSQSLSQSSLVLRKLFNFEPSLEYGLNVAFGLVYVRAMRGRAEGWSTK